MGNICCVEESSDTYALDSKLKKKLREKQERARTYKIDPKEQHRHRLLSRVGIYNDEVRNGAILSGNHNMLSEPPRMKENL